MRLLAAGSYGLRRGERHHFSALTTGSTVAAAAAAYSVTIAVIIACVAALAVLALG